MTYSSRYDSLDSTRNRCYPVPATIRIQKSSKHPNKTFPIQHALTQHTPAPWLSVSKQMHRLLPHTSRGSTKYHHAAPTHLGASSAFFPTPIKTLHPLPSTTIPLPNALRTPCVLPPIRSLCTKPVSYTHLVISANISSFVIISSSSEVSLLSLLLSSLPS